MAASFGGHSDRFLAQFPGAQRLVDALRSPRNPNPLFYFQRSQDPDLKGYWYVIGRLGPEMEASLSVRGEVLLIFSPYDDFQRRSYNAILAKARDEIVRYQLQVFGNVRFTPDARIALLHSLDDSVDTNVKAWNAEGGRSLVAVLPRLDSEAEYTNARVANAIAQVLASRDLYRGRNPVTGNDFFGRVELIQQLTAELRAGRSLGLFGLRRAGKTSVLREMRRRSEPTGIVMVLSDLEAVERVIDMVPQVSQDVVNALRRMREEGADVWVGTEAEQAPVDFGQLSARLVRLAEKNRSLHFVIAVDEIENLRRLSADSAESVRAFLGALRRAAQSTDNLTLFFTGVTTEFFDRSMLPGGLDNPLFGFVDAHFLRPFSRDEAAALVRDLGALMMLSWDEEALDLVHGYTGGFPFLVRDLASHVRTVARSEASEAAELGASIAVTTAHVTSARETWSESASDLWREIVRTLGSYHEMMAELVRCNSDQEITEWLGTGNDAEVAAANLARLGLLERANNGEYTRADVLIALQSLMRQGDEAIEELKARRRSADRIEALRRQPEGSSLEFKATARVNLFTGKRDDAIEFAIVKTVAAFLNTDGGVLLIGVSDAGEVRGIAEDLKLCKNSLDQYERWLCGDLLSQRIGADLVAEYVDFAHSLTHGRTVVEVTVRSASSVAWALDKVGEEALFVRNGNETRQLLGRQLVDYVQRRTNRP